MNKVFEQIRKNNLVLQIRYDYPDFLVEIRKFSGSHGVTAVINDEVLDKVPHPDEIIAEKILDAIEQII